MSHAIFKYPKGLFLPHITSRRILIPLWGVNFVWLLCLYGSYTLFKDQAIHLTVFVLYKTEGDFSGLQCYTFTYNFIMSTIFHYWFLWTFIRVPDKSTGFQNYCQLMKFIGQSQELMSILCFMQKCVCDQGSVVLWMCIAPWNLFFLKKFKETLHLEVSASL